MRSFLVLFVVFGVGIATVADLRVYSYPNGSESAEVEFKDEFEDPNGPTVFLDCGKEGVLKNPAPSFMYFVPLISPTLVDSRTSVNNEQRAGLIRCERKVKSESFCVCCEFQMQGKGTLKNTFDSTGMIDRNTTNLRKGAPLKNILDYIKFEGDGYGKVEVKGEIVDAVETVTEVNIHFNARGRRSPVTVGLYSVKPVNGEYKYENRYNELVGRVSTLTFKKTESTPKMAIKIASVGNDRELNGLWSNIKGAIANLFIKPLGINKTGNDAMLDFGYALVKEEAVFTFPKAENLKKEPRVARQKGRGLCW